MEIQTLCKATEIFFRSPSLGKLEIKPQSIEMVDRTVNTNRLHLAFPFGNGDITLAMTDY